MIRTNSPAGRRRLGVLPLVSLLYFVVVGGPYGVEAVVEAVGPGLAIAVLIAVPLVWSLPTALMVAELSAAMPVAGGYYAWVKRGLGSFWGFQEAWWSLIVSVVDTAIYPVLFATYAVDLLGSVFGIGNLDTHFARWALSLLLIWAVTGANLVGVRDAGWVAIGAAVGGCVPFMVLVAVAVPQLPDAATVVGSWTASATASSASTGLIGPYGVGLFLAMWNYQGWDGISTIATEVKRPERTIPLALGIVVILAMVTYLLPILVSLPFVTDSSGWSDGAWPAIAESVGGPTLRTAVAIGGVIAMAGLFNANLLAGSRILPALAADHYFPSTLGDLGAQSDVPHRSLMTNAIAYSMLSLIQFEDLAVVDVLVYGAALILEFVAFYVLRVREPEIVRPFRVPGGIVAISLVVAMPVILLGLAITDALFAEVSGQLLFAGGALLTGPLAWVLLTIFVKRGRPNLAVSVTYASAFGGRRWNPGFPGTPEIALRREEAPYFDRVHRMLPRGPRVQTGPDLRSG